MDNELHPDIKTKGQKDEQIIAETLMGLAGTGVDPFALAPATPEIYVQPPELAALKQAIKDGKTAVITGPLGIGKTALCEEITRELKRESLGSDATNQIVPVFLKGAAYNKTDDFIRGILTELALDTDKERAELLSIILRWPDEHPERLVIVVDDSSESGANVGELGELLRVIADIPRMALVLNGEPKSMQKFLEHNPPLRDRIQAEIKLRPMTPDESKEMITKRAKRHGVEYFINADAFDELYKLSKGVPRAALKAASKAFELARKEGKPIDKKLVKRANHVSFWVRLFRR